MTTDRGASEQEELAKAAIVKLQETSKWHIKKDGVVFDKGTGVGKTDSMVKVTEQVSKTVTRPVKAEKEIIEVGTI